MTTTRTGRHVQADCERLWDEFYSPACTEARRAEIEDQLDTLEAEFRQIVGFPVRTSERTDHDQASV